ncbi:MAG: type II secretion system protein [Coleofasciculaceae cyanobacterium RL_1_1]|nr:type II secretion system protein [Coleofasciculaceae cyanobacterium RL_1_1]
MIDQYQNQRRDLRLSRLSRWLGVFATIGETERDRSDRGFTIIEVLVVMVMIGILSAIAAPSWLTFVSTQRLTSAGNRALLAAREAQVKSKQQHRVWQVSFRDSDGATQYWVHPGDTNSSPVWQGLTEGDSTEIQIDPASSTLSADCGIADYCIKFEDRGILESEWSVEQAAVSDDVVGRITFQRRDAANDDQRRCLVVTSLLGSIQLNRDDDCS